MSLSIDAMTIYELKEQNEEQLIKYITKKTALIIKKIGSVFSNGQAPLDGATDDIGQSLKTRDGDDCDDESYSLDNIFTKLKKLTIDELKLQNKISLIEHVVVIKIISGMHMNMHKYCVCDRTKCQHYFITCPSCFQSVCGKELRPVGNNSLHHWELPCVCEDCRIDCPYLKYCNNVVERSTIPNYYTNWNLTGCQFYSRTEKNEPSLSLSCHCIYPLNDCDRCGKPCDGCVGNICNDHMDDFKYLFNKSFPDIIPNVLILLCLEYFFVDANININDDVLYATSNLPNYGGLDDILTSYYYNKNCKLINCNS